MVLVFMVLHGACAFARVRVRARVPLPGSRRLTGSVELWPNFCSGEVEFQTTHGCSAERAAHLINALDSFAHVDHAGCPVQVQTTHGCSAKRAAHLITALGSFAHVDHA